MNLSDTDYEHIREMTSKNQIILFLALKKIATHEYVDIKQNIANLEELTGYSANLIIDICNRLILDGHISQQEFSPQLKSGKYRIGPDNWK